MIATILLGIGLVFVIEGLALALAPSRIEQVLFFFASLSRDRRRARGLITVSLGTVALWLARIVAG